MRDLGTLGGRFSEAHGINAAGEVVGVAEPPSERCRAFLYRDGAMLDLTRLIDTTTGWTVLSADAINDVGQIAGFQQRRGQQHAVLLTPRDDARETTRAGR